MWKYIEQIDWERVSANAYNSDSVKRTVMDTYTEKTCNEIRAFAEQRKHDLHVRVEEYETEFGHTGDYSGDDGYGDMLWHVVGLGEDKFNEVMDNPNVLNGMPFVESFGYVLPYEGDYELLTANHHKEKALHGIAELTRIITHNQPSRDDLAIIARLMQSLILIRAGDFKNAVKGYTDENYASFYRFKSNDRTALFINVITNAREYLA